MHWGIDFIEYGLSVPYQPRSTVCEAAGSGLRVERDSEVLVTVVCILASAVPSPTASHRSRRMRAFVA